MKPALRRAFTEAECSEQIQNVVCKQLWPSDISVLDITTPSGTMTPVRGTYIHVHQWRLRKVDDRLLREKDNQLEEFQKKHLSYPSNWTKYIKP